MYQYHIAPDGFTGHDTPFFENDDLAIAYAGGYVYGMEVKARVYRKSGDNMTYIGLVYRDPIGHLIVTYSDAGQIIANPEPTLEPSISTERRMRFRGR